VIFGGTVSDFISNEPLAGTEVCVRDHPELACDTATTNGGFGLVVPALEEVVVEFTHEGHVTNLFHLRLDDDLQAILHVLVAQDAADYIVEQAGGEVDPAKGIVAMLAGSDGVVGSMTPMSGVGPVYLNSLGIPIEDLTETSSAGFFGFTNVDPGEYEVSWSHPTKTCTATTAWPGSTETSLRLTVEPDAHSSAFFIQCE
jgi:hypothetical protein